jgi:hypothetical protein
MCVCVHHLLDLINQEPPPHCMLKNKNFDNLTQKVVIKVLSIFWEIGLIVIIISTSVDVDW